jgi:prepilin-type N-terminal cleavage/methylation domain-containing protein
MTSSGRKGFTLPEVIIGMVVTLVLMGGVVLTLKSALDLYFKADAKALVTNGVRFTIDSYGRKIAPLLAIASGVEILEANSPIPANPGAYDHYVYLSEKSIKHKTQTSDEVLDGSDHIGSLSFMLPVSSSDIGPNYTLKMTVGGRHDKYESANIDITVDTALYSKPVKSGHVTAAAYVGSVLHFVCTPPSFEILLKNLRILKDNASGADLSNNDNISKGTKLYAGYTLEPSADPGYKLEDCSSIQWYVTGSSKVEIDAAAAQNGFPAPSDTNRESYCWLLVDSANNPLTGRTLDTNGVFYVRTTSGVKEWGNYGIIRYYIKSAMKKTGTDVVQNGPEQQSPFVAITKTAGEKGGKLWRAWTKNLQEILSGGSGDGSFLNTGVAGVELHIDYNLGETYLTLTMPQGGTAGSVTVAVSGGDLLADEKTEALESDGKSYTTVTNYSLIIDADVPVANGYGIFLNGATKSESDFKDCGFMFQYDRAIDSYLFRLYADGHHNGNQTTRDYGVGREYYYSSYYNMMISGGNSEYTGPFYGPGYLKNSLFKYVTSSSIDTRKNYTPWTERRRALLTVLEYYLASDGPEYPRYIVRFKLLKDFDSEKTSDPWQIGKSAFSSEPAWFGHFVGDSALKVKIKKNKYEYRYSIKNCSPYSGETVTLATEPADYTATDRYIVKSPWDSNDNSTKFVEAVFRGEDMDVRRKIQDDTFMDLNYNKSNQTKIAEVFKNPARKRYIGLRIWGGAGAQTRFYSVNYAPGFTKAELQAIMPSGAKMYELTDTKESEVLGVNQTNLNNGLFGPSKQSNGSGNGGGYAGVMGIQHILTGCTCPMCSK